METKKSSFRAYFSLHPCKLKFTVYYAISTIKVSILVRTGNVTARLQGIHRLPTIKANLSAFFCAMTQI